MESRELFKRVYQAQQEIKLLESRRRKYIEMASAAAGMSETNIRSHSNKSKTEQIAMKLVELADRMGNAVAEYERLVQDAEGLISRLERPRHRQVLTLRYIECMSWSQINKIMGYEDEKSVFRVHGWALKAAQKLLDDV